MGRPEFAGVVRDYEAHVRRVLSRYGVEGADLDELTQEVFLVAFEHRDELPRTRSRVRGWLRGIAFRVAQNWLRLAWTSRTELVDPAKLNAILGATGGEIEALVIVAEWLRSLPPLRRDIVTHRLRGLDFTEIGRAIGMPRSTVFAEWKRAQKRLFEESKRWKAR